MENALRKNGFFWSVPVLAGLLLLGACGRTGKRVWKGRVETDIAKLKARLSLEREVDPETQTAISRGTFAVFETRNAQKGKMIHLNVVVLHATGPEPRPDPVFFLAGGPGADISQGWKGYRKSWVREDRDIVLVSQRGTGGDNRLDCPKAASDDNLQRYLDPLFDLEIFQDCLEELKSRFDLTQYSTFAAADDLYEVRLALGYDRINLIGGSYGTRMALVYMRQHPETVRTAILNGVAPIAFRNPLYHAPAAQEAIRLILAKCAADPECHAAYPDLEGEFLAVLDRLEKQPAEVMITHPVSKERVTVTLTRAAFAEALRTIMYSSATVRMVPDLIHKAFEGDYEPFAQRGLASNRRIRTLLALGMLLCVTCAEDISRIDPEEIPEVIGDSFLRDDRVRQQMAACAFWPRSVLPEDYGEDVSVGVPVLLLSGTLDPVTPPKWGEEAARHLPNSLHLVVPGAHGVGGACLRDIQKRFLDAGTVAGLDTSCTQDLMPIAFIVPKEKQSP